MTSRLLLNRAKTAVKVTPVGAVQAIHRRLLGIKPSPLVELPELAAVCGVGRVLVKVEVERLGLPSFKILGASWATYQVLAARLGTQNRVDWSSIDELAEVIARELGPLRLVTATDGNHGRAVAHMARLLGLSATILVPTGTAAARMDGIAGEGADVVVVDGSYDDAVAESARLADERVLVVSDTSWPGYEAPSRWVIDGYSTIFAELDTQLSGVAARSTDLIVVPLGVGALGAAAASHFAGAAERAGRMPLLVGVEPETAASVAAAVDAGRVVEVPGPHRSIMAGLNCGRASPVALPMVAAGFDAFLAIDDRRAAGALRALAGVGLDVGETGAAAYAGLTALVDEHRSELPLAADAVVVLLATEGVTDPINFEAIVDRPPHTPRQ